ncbi:patatin-like phospholipase family protein [Croceivirga sp. JEA036]|uniref:patatin-like phospholipase family protein n=1 Tax=Croceivirga sp. JEA036 TaxID=2721162 RepID=UPI00143AF46D|nr:patatin-like phospholipase family protein [Croceivirga sp. JEA036]NJB36906.1 patatin [Croceivirga sp. JEA036]
MKKHIVILIVFCSLFLTHAQDKKRPKVGLVLSGGGAKGMAHIGALKVIEDAGIEIDYIGGTSMGAIIGGLYAAGYTAYELDSIFKSTNLSLLIQDKLPRDAKTFYEKDDAERYTLTLPFDNFKVSFPEGISGGQNIYNEFVKLLYHVKDVDNFNELPTPFLCIATNIETGKAVLMDRGYLPEAMMASGTLPSLFEPSEIDNQILIDGGVVNNYPIDEIRAKGADIIIGIDVQDDLAVRESLSSATDILMQINNYRTANDMIKKKEKTDIYLKPNIKEFSVIDFEKTGKIIERGEVAAKAQLNQLKAIAEQQNTATKTKVSKSVKDSLTINRLIIKGNEAYTRGYIKGKLRFTLGNQITFDKLQQGIGNLAATNNFKAIRYKLTSNGLGTDLTLFLKEDPTRMYIKMGAHYDDLFKSAALINLTRKKLFLKDDVASFDLIVGDHIRYNFQYYLDKGFYWSFGINSNFASFDEEVNYDIIRRNFDFGANQNLSEIRLDFSDLTNQIYVQTVIREEFAFRMGLEHKHLKFSTTTLNNLPPTNNQVEENAMQDRVFFEKSDYISTYGRLRFDTYDDKYFPTRGLFLDGDFHYYIYSSDFNNNFKDFSVTKGKLGMALPLFPKLSLTLESEAGFKLGTAGVSSFDFILGGYGNQPINNIIPFVGYDYVSLIGNSFIKAGARLDYEFSPKNHLLFMTNFANVADDLYRTGDWFTAPDYSGFGIGYGLESFLGPAQILYSWTPQQNDGTLFFSIGYWF